MPHLNFMVAGDPLSLSTLRSILARLEDTVIFSLIERAQFAHNPKIYQRGAFKELKDLGFEGSWLEWFLNETESFHSRARRYSSPDEYPFTAVSQLPKPVLPPLNFPPILYPNNINANPSILSFYTRSIIPRITARATLLLSAAKRANGVVGDEEYEDDGNHGSAATVDIEVLQAISKRVHYGKFIAESKFRAKPSDFVPHILKPNPAALENLIVKPEIEQKLLLRLRKKALIYAQDPVPDGELTATGSEKIDVDGVVDLYASYIIPLTKEVEVEYLLHRLDGLTQEEIEKLAKPE